MSTAALRDAFNAVSEPAGIRCSMVRLNWCDAKGGVAGLRDHVTLTFELADGAHAWTVGTDPIPPAADLTSAARQMAQQTIAGTHA